MFNTGKDNGVEQLTQVPLEELVTKTLCDIASGVAGAAEKTKEVKVPAGRGTEGFRFSASRKAVKFDVSVSAQDSTEQGAGAKIVAVPFASAAGSTKRGAGSSSVARVQFGVTIFQSPHHG